MNKIVLNSLKVNVKSLAAESRIIREEIRKATDSDEINSLHHHRMTCVRPESRLAQLSLAFARNKPYKGAEPKADKLPDSRRLCRKLQRFLPETTQEEVDAWLQA